MAAEAVQLATILKDHAMFLAANSMGAEAVQLALPANAFLQVLVSLQGSPHLDSERKSVVRECMDVVQEILPLGFVASRRGKEKPVYTVRSLVMASRFLGNPFSVALNPLVGEVEAGEVGSLFN